LSDAPTVTGANLPTPSIAEAIVDRIIYDILGRCGLGDLWAEASPVANAEIKAAWMIIVRNQLAIPRESDQGF
jgi:hypothetical protein